MISQMDWWISECPEATHLLKIWFNLKFINEQMPMFDVSAQIQILDFRHSSIIWWIVIRSIDVAISIGISKYSISIQMSSSVWFVVPKQIQSSTEILSFDCLERFIEIFVENHLLLYDLNPNLFINLLNCVVCEPLLKRNLCLKHFTVKINSKNGYKCPAFITAWEAR